MSEKLTNFDPKPELVQFASNLAWRSQPVPMINVIAYKPGSQAGIIAVVAHRDGGGVQPPIGSGLLVALGKALNPLKLRRGVVLVSTDGGTTGGQGADQFARTWPQADQIVSAITIDSIAGTAGGDPSVGDPHGDTAGHVPDADRSVAPVDRAGRRRRP